MSRSAFALAAVIAALATQAHAHAHLVKSDPADETIVAAPAAVNLQFSEKLSPKLSKAVLTKMEGSPPIGASAVDAKDAHNVKITAKAPLAAGKYKVAWTAVSADAHKTQGEFTFTVK